MTALADLQTGDVLRAAWGEYVYRGIAAHEGRVPLADRANPTAWVWVDVERLAVDYQLVGRIEESHVRVPLRRLHDPEDGPVEVLHGVVVQALPRDDQDGALPQPVVVDDPPQPLRKTASRRTTLGALRPPSNSRGMVRETDGAGAQVILPDVETLYWLPCPVEGEAMPLEVGGEAKVLPHAFHITSSHYGGIYCPACYARKRGRTLPLHGEVAQNGRTPCEVQVGHGDHVEQQGQNLQDVGETRQPSPTSCVPDGALGLETTARSAASPAPEGTLSFMAQPEAASASAPAVAYEPSGSIAGAPPAAPIVDPSIAAIADRIMQRLDGVPTTPAPTPGAAPKRPAWHNDPPRPNRADFERSQWWEERAALIEHLGGYPREVAELRAYEDMKLAAKRGEIW